MCVTSTPPTPAIRTISLHDALPISRAREARGARAQARQARQRPQGARADRAPRARARGPGQGRRAGRGRAGARGRLPRSRRGAREGARRSTRARSGRAAMSVRVAVALTLLLAGATHAQDIEADRARAGEAMVRALVARGAAEVARRRAAREHETLVAQQVALEAREQTYARDVELE